MSCLTYDDILQAKRRIQSFGYSEVMDYTDLGYRQRLFINDPHNNFCGMRIIQDSTMIEQYRKPRSKGKRIAKKWQKDPANYRPQRFALVNTARGLIYCHSSVMDEIRQQVRAGVSDIKGPKEKLWTQ
jgi:hypothetical protein